jgi:hypothetical protein
VSGAGSITLNLKTGSLSNPVSTSLGAILTSICMGGSCQVVGVSGTLTANGAGLGNEPIILVIVTTASSGYYSYTVTVTTASSGKYSYSLTSYPTIRLVYAFYLGDYTGSPQYLPSYAATHWGV